MDQIAIKKYGIQLLLSVFLSSFFLLSCEFDEIKDIKEIVTLLIKKTIEEDALYSNDSLKTKERLFINGKFVVVVDTEMTPVLNNFGLREHQQEFKRTFEKLHSLKQPEKMSFQIEISLNDVLITDFTPHLKEIFRKGRVYKSFHSVISFSRVAIFNNTALVTYGEASSPQDVTSYLVYLKKEKGKWVLFDRKVLSIS